MKRLILKFKHWLIKKLGGYTEQQVINQRIDVHSHQFQPVVLRANTRMDLRLLLNGNVPKQDICDRIIQELGRKLADEIIEKRLFVIDSEDDHYSNARIYQAEIFLIHPHDAAMGSLTRREEL